MSFHPRQAFVTGVSGGLGRAFAERLLAEGVQVWGSARDAARVPAGIRPVVLDLADAASIARAVAQVRAEAPGLDLLINNAGAGVHAPLETLAESDLEAQWRVLLHGPASLARAFYSDFRTRGRGMVVNVTSLAGDYPIPFMSAYSGAKAGLSAFTRTLMLESVGSGVSVVDFRPGDYATKFSAAMPVSNHGGRADSLRARAAAESHESAGPSPELAARHLWGAVSAGRSRVVVSGDFWQSRLGPLLARLAPESVVRAYLRRYYGL